MKSKIQLFPWHRVQMSDFFCLSDSMYSECHKSELDWQDSRISRGNGKWICGKIPAGNEVREIAGKIDQLWSKLVQNLFKYGLKAGSEKVILVRNLSHQFLVGKTCL